MWPLTFAVFRRPVAKGRRRGCLFALFLLFCLFFFWCFEAPSGAFFFSGSARGGRTAPNRTTRAPTRVKSSHSPGSLSLSLSLSLSIGGRAQPTQQPSLEFNRRFYGPVSGNDFPNTISYPNRDVAGGFFIFLALGTSLDWNKSKSSGK